MKKALAIFLCIAMLLCAAPLAIGSAATTELHFNNDGKFKILVLADCQDDYSPDGDMMEAINQLLDLNKPDLVVLTGDNVVEDKVSEFTQGATALLNPIVTRGIPYAFTFGNHDDEYGVSKDEQFAVYQSLGTCLTTDPVPSLYGVGTCNIPIYSSTGSSMAFNLWMVDSNTYDKTNGGYDYVHSDQLNWMTQKQSQITAQEGHVVNSIIFQHIIVPEITNCLVQSSSGAWTYNGTKYALQFKSGMGSGSLLEHPCPSLTNGGEYSTAVSMGGVLGIVTGHDHTNDFIAKPGGVDLIQVGGMSYNSYGDDSVRGASLITLDESNTGTYTIQRFLNTKLFAGDYGYSEKDPVYVQIPSKTTTYISDVSIGDHASDGATAKKQLTDAGYTVIDFDLNKGAGGDYIYLGYKTTTNIDNAITSLRVTNVQGSGYSSTKTYRGIEYNLASNIDLNKGISSSNYIYLYYTKQAKAGAPITALTVNETATTSGYTAVGSFASDAASDLNKKAKGSYIYIQMASSLTTLSVSDFFDAYEQAIVMNTTGKAPERATALKNAISAAQPLYDTLKDTCRTTSSQTVIDAREAELRNALANINKPHVHVAGTAATCTTAQYCTLCKEEIAPAKGHSYSVASQIAATCKSTGLKEYVCSACGDRYTETIPVTNIHTPVAIPAVEAKNCKTEGFTAGTKCSVCNKVLTAPVSTGYGDHTPKTVDAVPATCTSTGKTEGTKCYYCGIVLTAQQDIPMTEHTPAEAVTENLITATCLKDGSYDTVVYCSGCGKELSREGHTIKATSTPHVETSIAPVTATNCKTEGFTAGTKCAVCGEILNAPVSTGFGPHTETAVKGYAPTCTSTGKTDGVKCSLCDTVITAQQDIPVVAHTAGTMTIENVTDATCTAEGSYDEVIRCTVCNLVLSRNSKTTAIVAHTEGTIAAVTAADCKTEGFTAGTKCTVCGLIMTAPVSTGYGPHTETAVKGYAATCTKTGKTDGSVCALCGETITAQQTIPVVAHTEGAKTIENVKNATCTAEGSYDEVIYCTVCRQELSRNTKTTEKVTHTEGTIPAVAATDCKTEGFTAGTKCTVCGEILTAPVSTGYGAHKSTTLRGTAATCENTGLSDGTKCLVCGETLTAQTVIPALGHKEKAPVRENSTASTCTVKGGYDTVVYCATCNKELSRVRTELELAAHKTGRAVTENEVAGTCQKAGTVDKVTYCIVCSKELSRKTETTTYGEHVKGAAVIENKTPATCTATGCYDEVVYCTVCKKEISRTIRFTDKVSHNDGNGDSYCDSCGYDMSVNCSHLCHKTGFLGFIWKIINLFNKLFKINGTCSCGKAHY